MAYFNTRETIEKKTIHARVWQLYKHNQCFDFLFASYEHEGPVITYDNGDNNANYKIDTFTSDQTTFNWDTVTTRDKRDHGIHARVNPSTFKPFIPFNSCFNLF